ncbi:tyrosine-type recombinase/integrase [Mycobacterium seoulense]|uniref:tyrosine-type recombinase/integrase n=1 Tax=Mycobacterium seoulense TaxID=386911 RepID=UPI003CFB393C
MARRRRGFGRIRQCQPSGRYQASYVGPDDKLHKAPETFDAREDAEAWLADRRREIDRELWSPPATTEQKKAKRKAEVKFGDYAEKWLETRTVRGRPIKLRTREHYEALLEHHVYPTFKTKALRDISMESVDRWYARTLKDRPTTRAHTYSLLRTILETARTRDRIIDVNPCLIRGAGTTERKVKPKPATLEQLDIITAEMPENLSLMVLLASWCALRFGELVELRRNDIDLEDAVINVRRAAVRVEEGWSVGDPKSDAGKRDVAIPPHILPAVKRHLTKHVGKEPDSLLFPPKSGEHHLQPSTLYRHFYRARAKAKRPDLRFHDLRHSGAVMAAQTGATLAELMARLGHSTPQAAMRYQHQAEGRDKAIAAALSELAKRPDLAAKE